MSDVNRLWKITTTDAHNNDADAGEICDDDNDDDDDDDDVQQKTNLLLGHVLGLCHLCLSGIFCLGRLQPWNHHLMTAHL